MDKIWYPVAFSVLIVGCGGEVDTDKSSTSGGSTSVDDGTPTASGGTAMVLPPPYGVLPSAYGGASGTGGSTFTLTAQSTRQVATPIDAGVPTATGGGPTHLYGVR